MKIGILEAGMYPAAKPGGPADYGEMFAELLGGHGFTFRPYKLFDMEFPDSPEDCDAWLITGSRLGTYDDDPLIAPLEDLVRAIIAKRRQLLGICFGHQIIAQALGGEVRKWPGGWCLGITEYAGTDGPFRLNAFHQDQVTRLPRDAVLTASNETCANAGFRIGETVQTYQAHPEYTNPIFTAMVEKRREILPSDRVAEAETKLDQFPDTEAIVAEMVAHLKKGQADG